MGGRIRLFLLQIPRFGLVWTTQRFYLLVLDWMINNFVSREVPHCRHSLLCLHYWCCVGWGPACYVVEFKQIWFFRLNFWFTGNTLEHYVFNFFYLPLPMERTWACLCTHTYVAYVQLMYVPHVFFFVWGTFSKKFSSNFFMVNCYPR